VSAHLVIKCEGDWFGFPCRGAITVPVWEQGGSETARLHGWSVDGGYADRCPAHTLADARLQEMAR